MESSQSDSSLNENEAAGSIDIIDIGEFSWSDRLRPKPKIQGKYLRGDILGQGTFAKVYEVMDIKTLQRRAVKIFDMQKIDRKFNREEMTNMVNQEVALLSSCNHRNVIKVVDVHRSYPLHGEKSVGQSMESLSLSSQSSMTKSKEQRRSSESEAAKLTAIKGRKSLEVDAKQLVNEVS